MPMWPRDMKVQWNDIRERRVVAPCKSRARIRLRGAQEQRHRGEVGM